MNLTTESRRPGRLRTGPAIWGGLGLLLVMLAALVLPLAAATAPATPPARDGWFAESSLARADEESGLELIAAAYNVLQDRFFRPLDSRTLLNAAWQGARRGLSDQRRPTSGIEAPTLVGDRAADLETFSAQYRLLLAQAGSGVDGARVAMTAADAMTDSVGEQHTVFLPPEAFARFKEGLTTERGQVGVGIVIDGERAPFTIASVVPMSPADQAGVQEGDQILQVDGRDVARLDLRDLQGLLRGEAGQPVTLTLRRNAETVDLTIVRGRFVISPLTVRVLPEGVCYLRLSTFPVVFAVGPSGRTIAEELDVALERCEQAGTQGWIMDLRGNGGGSSVAQITGRFLDHGPILVERDRNGSRFEQAPSGHLFRVQRPLVVMIDGGSASASEAFASAVQEYRRGVVVGQRSAGALNTANVLPLPLNAGIEVAIREVFSGVREIAIDRVGVTPDVALAGTPDSPEALRRAVELALSPPAGVGPLPAPAPGPAGAVLSVAELRQIIEPVQLRPEDAETPEDAIIPGDLPIDTLNYYASDSPNLEAARQRALRLGWQGGLVRWLGRGFPPPYALDVELYRDADGAHRDFREVYEPDEPHNPPQYRDAELPVWLGDDTRALIGTGQNEGRIWIAWRRGNVNYVVARNVLPGQSASFDGLVRLAQIVDARAAALGR